MQRPLIITVSVLVLLGLGLFVYFYFFTGPSVTIAPGGIADLPIAGQTQPPSGPTDSDEIPTIYSPGTPVTVTSRLVQISKGPVVPGAAVMTSKALSASSSPITTVNYIERQSGNVFSYRTDARTLTRTNNKTLLGIQSAAWLPNGSMAYVRYLSGTDFSTINTYALAASSSQGFFLPQNLSDISVSSTNILTLTSGVNGSIVSRTNTDGTRSSTVFTTPLTSLRVSFAGSNQYLVFTKPSSTLPGTAFLVNSSGSFSRIAGPLDGLAALVSPSGKWVLVSYTESGSLRMQLVNVATGTALQLPVTTIVDKCVWAADESSLYCGIPVRPPTASYPDDWYQGAVHFEDRIWKIYVDEHYAQMVLDFTEATEDTLDAEALAIDAEESTLVFTNRNDGSLWSFSL